MARPRFALGMVLAALTRVAAAGEGAPPPADLPLGVSSVLYTLSVPAGAAPTPEKVALGEKLFNDKRLSVTVNPIFSDQKFHNIGIAAHKTDFIGMARRATGLPDDDRKLRALEAYILAQRKGTPLEYGKH